MGTVTLTRRHQAGCKRLCARAWSLYRAPRVLPQVQCIWTGVSRQCVARAEAATCPFRFHGFMLLSQVCLGVPMQGLACGAWSRRTNGYRDCYVVVHLPCVFDCPHFLFWIRIGVGALCSHSEPNHGCPMYRPSPPRS